MKVPFDDMLDHREPFLYRHLVNLKLFLRPYCAKLCNYCNFNKYVNKDEKNVLRIGKCLMLEGSSLIKKAQIEKIDTIYFGGGTPSLMPTKVLSVSHAIS